MPFPKSFAARLPVRWLVAAALIGASSLPALAVKNLTAVLESEVVFLDPHFTTASITRTFNYMV
jgi:peptide/nickel transport system substrate-binding protein